MSNPTPRNQLERDLKQALENLTSVQKLSTTQLEELRYLRARIGLWSDALAVPEWLRVEMKRLLQTAEEMRNLSG